MNGRDGRQGLRVVERFASGELDQHVDRIGARELGVDPAARRHGLLLVRDLIGEPISRLEIGIDVGQRGDDRHADQAVKAGTAHHPGSNPGAEAAQQVEAQI